MSRTWDLLYIKKPLRLPHTETITCEASVTSFGETSETERDGKWWFIVGPTYFGSPIIRRLLCLSKNKEEKTDFTSILAGEVEIKGEVVYLFLEEN